MIQLGALQGKVLYHDKEWVEKRPPPFLPEALMAGGRVERSSLPLQDRQC